MRRLLSDPVPLRTTADQGEYREVRTLPWVYGTVTLSPIPADRTGREWLLADHPILNVQSVAIGGTETSGWQHVHRPDATGRPVAVLLLTQPPRDNNPVVVTLAGKRDRSSGALITHPADIVTDLLTESGWTVPRWWGDNLRADFPGLVLGGLLDNHTQTLRAALDMILRPLGVVWSASPWVAREDTPGTPVTPLRLENATADAVHTDLATELRGTYAYDYAARKPRRALRVEASVDRFGRIARDWPMPWVQQARDAERILRRQMARLARPMWQVSGAIPLREPLPEIGDTVRADHPLMPIAAGLLTLREINRDQARVVVAAKVPAGPEPTVSVLSSGLAIDAAGADTIDVVFRDGLATFTILDDAGSPLAGVSVTLDSIVTRSTDQFGRVQFETDPGPHTLTIVATGFEPFELDLIL